MEKYFTNKPNEIIYFSQRNNAIFPMRSCFPTSLAMAMRNNGFSYYDKFKHPAYGTLELDDYIMYLSNSEVGNNIASMLKIPKGTPFLNEWWSVMAQVGNYLLKPQNMSCKWVTLDIAGIKREIDAGRMVVVGTLLTHRGHIVTVSGYEDNNLILCDPYGNVLYNYPPTSSGLNVKLTANLMPLIKANCIVFSKNI
jgi:uncharacterized protein YvpB